MTRRAGWRPQVGKWLRDVADGIDRDHAPRHPGISFTFEKGVGVKTWLSPERRGCLLWYLSDEDYERAYTDAVDPVPVRINWTGRGVR